MKRGYQILLIATFIAFSWLAMQVVHELGHVLGAAMTGGEVIKVVLHPLVISRTDVFPNPEPLFVVWSGPIVGVAIPLLMFAAAKVSRSPGMYLFRFFAAFCLIANGVYIAAGPVEGGADTGVMMQYGSPRWLMITFGFLTAPLGLYLLNRQGRHFGLGAANGTVNRRAVVVSVALLVVLAGVELIVNSR